MKKEIGKTSLLYRIGVMFGTDRFHNVMTAVCIVAGVAWVIVYIVCAACRDSMLAQTAADLARRGEEEYRLVISSPMFTALKISMYFIPVASILWAVSTVSAEKKKKLLCEKKLLFTALACIAAASFAAVIDLARVHMIFG